MPGLDDIVNEQRYRMYQQETFSTRQLLARGQSPSDKRLDLVGPGYRSISGGLGYGPSNESITDLPQHMRNKMMAVGLYLAYTNGFARMLINNYIDYTVGGGFYVSSDSDRVQEILDAFWYHPHNNLDRRIRDVARELAIYGEVLHSIGFGDRGLMFIHPINPVFIHKVVPAEIDLSHMVSIDLIPELVVEGSKKSLLLPTLDKSGRLVAEATHLRLNAVSDATRGISDLLPLGDIIAEMENVQFNALQRENHLGDFFWDVEFQGMNDQQIREKATEIRQEPVYPGMVRLHNERVKWTVQVPKVDSKTNEIIQSAFHTFVTNAQIPKHWTAFGDATATGAEAANDPAYRRLGTRQRIIAELVMSWLDLQLDRAVAMGLVAKKDRRNYSIHTRPVAVRDLQRLGGAAEKMVASIKATHKDGYISGEAAVEYITEVYDSVFLSSGRMEPNVVRNRRRKAAHELVAKMDKKREEEEKRREEQGDSDDDGDDQDDDQQADNDGDGKGGDKGSEDDDGKDQRASRLTRSRRRGAGQALSS